MNLSMIGLGCLGGALPDIIRIAQDRYKAELPSYLKTVNFWLGFAFLLILGGLSAYLANPKDVQSALALGFGAPEIISRLLSTKKTGDAGFTGTAQSVRRWWTY